MAVMTAFWKWSQQTCCWRMHLFWNFPFLELNNHYYILYPNFIFLSWKTKRFCLHFTVLAVDSGKPYNGMLSPPTLCRPTFVQLVKSRTLDSPTKGVKKWRSCRSKVFLKVVLLWRTEAASTPCQEATDKTSLAFVLRIQKRPEVFAALRWRKTMGICGSCF